MLGGVAAVHPAPRRALKRVVKGRDRGDGDDGDDGVRIASAVDDAHATAATGTREDAAEVGRSADEDDAEDSDYSDDDDASDASGGQEDSDDEEEEDSVEHRLALQAELDECADDGRQDVYLERMLAERGRLEGDDAAWVDRYVALQQQWKDRHAYSIDDFDLDVRLRTRLQNALSRSSARTVAAAATKKRKTSKAAVGSKRERAKATTAKKPRRRRRAYSRVARAFWRFWYLRVAPTLPLELQEERAEYVVVLFALLAFVALSLAIQVFAAVREA